MLSNAQHFNPITAIIQRHDFLCFRQAFRLLGAITPNVQVPGNRCHGAHFFDEIQAATGGFDICVAEVDQRDKIWVTERPDRLHKFGRCLAILAGLGRENVFEGDAHAIGSAEFSQFMKRIALSTVGVGAFCQLVRA